MKVIEPAKAAAEDDCLQAAAVWISRINSGHPTSGLLRDLRRWLDERPENAAAFRQMEHLWSRLAVVRDAVLQGRTVSRGKGD